MLILCFLALAVNILFIAVIVYIFYGLIYYSKLIISFVVFDILVIFSVFMYILIKVLVALVISLIIDKMEERLILACMFQFVNSINITVYLISLFNFYVMVFDYYIFVMQLLYYYYIMNNFRGNLMIIIFWVIVVIGGFFNFFVGFGKI